ncbi:MAG: NUDIX domain-containing protein, partial [Verrucomicrobiae bacterium]|nr:NUDIX domain-containing protein [Verrucomicrobiae bacterium]
AHPGGPGWSKKDEGAWTLPKGEIGEGEEPIDAARREFYEETGFTAEGPFLELAPVRQKSGKLVRAWAFEGDCKPEKARSNFFMMEWPPHSGKNAEFPEIDRVEFFDLPTARMKANPAQIALIDELERRLV